METIVEINSEQSAATRNRNGKKALENAAKAQEEKERKDKISGQLEGIVASMEIDEKKLAEQELKKKQDTAKLHDAIAEGFRNHKIEVVQMEDDGYKTKAQAEADKGDLRQAIKYILASEDKDERESWVSNALKCDMATMEAEIVEATKKEIIAKEMHKSANDYLKALKEVIAEKMDMASEEEKMPLLKLMIGEA